MQAPTSARDVSSSRRPTTIGEAHPPPNARTHEEHKVLGLGRWHCHTSCTFVDPHAAYMGALLTDQLIKWEAERRQRKQLSEFSRDSACTPHKPIADSHV
jgi:hypothetical protein